MGIEPWNLCVGCVSTLTDSDAVAAIQSKMFEISAGKLGNLRPQLLRRKVKIGRLHQIANAAALVGLFDASPAMFQFRLQRLGLIDQHRGVGKQIKQSVLGARHRRVKLPAGKHRDASGAHCLLHNVFRPRDPLSRKPCMNRFQNFFAHRGFGERQQHSFLNGAR